MTLEVSPILDEVRSLSEVVLVLPYGLSIVDHYQIFTAIGGRPVRRIGDRKGDEFRFVSVFDLYDFDRAIDEVSVTISVDGANFVHWDAHERFVVVAGTTLFCSLASPYPSDVRQHYFIEGFILAHPEDDPEVIYRTLSRE